MIKTYLVVFGIISQLASGWNTIDQSQYKQVSYVSRPVAKNEISPTPTKINESEMDYIGKIEAMGITLHPGSDFTQDNRSNPSVERRCAALVYNTLAVMPAKTVNNLKNLTLYFSPNGRRGLGGGSTIILRCENVSDQELVSVLVHEMGHIEDTGVLKGNFWSGESEFKDNKTSIYNDDTSLDFYRISFENDQKLKTEASDLDFVSGYAKSDPFEDFAETYNYYLLHGNNFRELATTNDALTRKYDFMKEKVFSGQEFDFDNEVVSGLDTSRIYDSTVISYNLQKFLAI